MRNTPPSACVGRADPNLLSSGMLGQVCVKPRSASPPCGVFPFASELPPMATGKAEEYRTKAREAEQLAEQARNFAIREQLLNIAQQWKAMAAFEEKYER